MTDTLPLSEHIWTNALETMHRHQLQHIIAHRTWIYSAGHPPDDWMHVTIEQVEKVWIYAIITIHNLMHKITTCLPPQFAYENDDIIIQYLTEHTEQWKQHTIVQFPKDWITYTTPHDDNNMTTPHDNDNSGAAQHRQRQQRSSGAARAPTTTTAQHDSTA